MADSTELEQMRAQWRALARYTLFRSEGRGANVTRTVLGSDLPYDEAMARKDATESELVNEPGYRSYVMSRTLICIELERPQETLAAYRALREEECVVPQASPIFSGG